MSNYIVDGSDLTSVANAIRAKSGGSSSLAFPAGFVSEIENIPSGGATEVTISDSGAVTQALDPDKIYHFTGNLTSLTITLNGALSDTYQFDFVSGATPPTFSFPLSVGVPNYFEILARCKTEIVIKNNKMFCVGVVPILPEEYSKVNCVSISAGGYVNTGVSPYNKRNKIDCDVRLDTPISSISGSCMIYGARKNNNYAFLGVYASIAGFVPQFGGTYTVTSNKDNDRHFSTYEPNGGEFFIDRRAFLVSDATLSVAPDVPMLIAARQESTGSGAENFAALTLWGYSHYTNLVCAINLVPCKQISTSEFGFYDTVSGTFFGNSGSGTFTEGVE